MIRARRDEECEVLVDWLKLKKGEKIAQWGPKVMRVVAGSSADAHQCSARENDLHFEEAAEGRREGVGARLKVSTQNKLQPPFAGGDVRLERLIVTNSVRELLLNLRCVVTLHQKPTMWTPY